MLLSEALAKRKAAIASIDVLQTRWGELAVVDSEEDNSEAAEEIEAIKVKIAEASLEVRSLTVAINKKNNSTSIVFEGIHMSLMEAIAFRDALVVDHRIKQRVLSDIQSRMGISSGRRYYNYERAKKDDVKEVSLTDLKELREQVDELSARKRELDVAIQKANWSTQL